MRETTTRIANRLFIPDNTQAILWDMDGVLIDSLGLDLQICNTLLTSHFGEGIQLSHQFIRDLFAYHPAEFWRIILKYVVDNFNIRDAFDKQAIILDTYNTARLESFFPPNPGIIDILKALRPNFKTAVVSNNLTQDVENTLKKSGIRAYFDLVVGNDLATLEKKPAPDTYLFAAKSLGIQPRDCVVIEDSLIGAQAGYRAGCRTICVATGGADYDQLTETQWAHDAYLEFSQIHLKLQFGDVRKKNIHTPNDFVSHMIEHIAWRLGIEIDLQWNNDNWWALGQYLGTHINKFDLIQTSGAALGMIDDGSAEVTLKKTQDIPALHMSAVDELDLDWFLSVRCEQLNSGQPLLALLEGLSIGLGAHVCVQVCSAEDPHHTWEGIFRAIGITLSRMYTPQHQTRFPVHDSVITSCDEGEIRVLEKSLHRAKVTRGTAESYVTVTVDFHQKLDNKFIFNVADSIDVSGFPALLERFAEKAGLTLSVEFNTTVLNSSHVVLEDTALVLGRALKEILILRMAQVGVNGAGSSIQRIDDISASPIHTGVSVEGRKFWLFVPFKISHNTLKKNFLVGQDVHPHLRSEDLDDFLDGLAGGLECSIIVHVHELVDANTGWKLIFDHLGKSLAEVFAVNPYRKGVPPGVKATLA